MPDLTAEELAAAEEMSLEDLRALAGGQPAVASTPVVAPEPTPESTPVLAPTVFRREIDLGDGGGKQVFEASTLEALTDKLVDAQRNATQKIREQSRQLKERDNPEALKPLTPDEEFVLSQEMISKPSVAFDKLFQRRFGMTVEQAKINLAQANKVSEEQDAQAAQRQWTEAHPDYYASAPNGKRMMQYLDTYRLPITVDNIQKAFDELTTVGLLEKKPGPKPQAAPAAPAARASGLSTSASAAPPAKGKELTEEDLYAMPMNDFLKLGKRSASNDNW